MNFNIIICLQVLNSSYGRSSSIHLRGILRNLFQLLISNGTLVKKITNGWGVFVLSKRRPATDKMMVHLQCELKF